MAAKNFSMFRSMFICVVSYLLPKRTEITIIPCDSEEMAQRLTQGHSEFVAEPGLEIKPLSKLPQYQMSPRFP